jgi:hypothetical protein
MSGQGTRKLHEATEAFMHDLEGARWTMMRVAQIQAKMSQCMDECLTEFGDLFPNAQTQDIGQAPQPVAAYPGPGLAEQLQNELPRILQYGGKPHRNNGD